MAPGTGTNGMQRRDPGRGNLRRMMARSHWNQEPASVESEPQAPGQRASTGRTVPELCRLLGQARSCGVTGESECQAATH